MFGIDNAEKLEEAEAFVFAIRAAQVEQDFYKINGYTEGEFLRLHKHLFQDLYDFAGQYRDVQLIKGNTRFCQVQYLETYAKDLFHQMAKESNWPTLEVASKRMSYFTSEINMLHPFRDGNGRTTRIFLHSYAKSKNYSWDYEYINVETYMNAMIRSAVSEDLLEQLFLHTLNPL